MVFNKKLVSQFIMLGFCLGGCAQSTIVLTQDSATQATQHAVNTLPAVFSPTPTILPMSTATPSTEPTPTPSPIPTVEPTLIPTLDPGLPTPDFMQSAIADGYILATSGLDCQLPCWQGLQVGTSTRQDVLDVFNALFGFGSYVDFFDVNVAQRDGYSKALLYIPGMDGGGYMWMSQETIFALFAVVDKKTNVLKGLLFQHSTGLYYEGWPHRYAIRTPQQLIKQLGTPSAIYTRTQSDPLMGVMLFFEEGIVSHSLLDIKIGQRSIEGQTKNYAEFCLDDQAWSATDIILEPFESNPDVPIPSNNVSENWVIQYMELTGLYPVEDTLSLTIEEFVAISQSNHPCIDLDYDQLPDSIK